jgi:hypothetical protein
MRDLQGKLPSLKQLPGWQLDLLTADIVPEIEQLLRRLQTDAFAEGHHDRGRS